MKNFELLHFGSGGAHGQDFARRGFLQDIHVTPIPSADTPLPKKRPDASLITVPISKARGLVDKLLREYPGCPTIDASGIWRSSKVGIPLPTYDAVSFIHCLFGPKSTGNLNIVHHTSTPYTTQNSVFHQILGNALRQDGESTYQLNPVPIEVQDAVMGFVQAFAHILGILLAEMKVLPDEIMERRRLIPSSTIKDMIALNPHVISLIHEMDDEAKDNTLLEVWSTMIRAMETYLHSKGLQLGIFETPFFRLMRTYISSNGQCFNANAIRERALEIAHQKEDLLVARVEASKASS